MAHYPWHLKGRIMARYHVQVELIEKAIVSRTPVHASIFGKVMRVFRGDDRLCVGSDVRFSIAVAKIEDDRPFGGEPWMLFTKFQIAKYMEAFLEGTPPVCEVCLGQVAVIWKLTDSPSMRMPSAEELENLPLIPPTSELNTSNVV
jgi:hypothetical protein